MDPKPTLPFALLVDYATLSRDLCGALSVTGSSDTLTQYKNRLVKLASFMEAYHLTKVAQTIRKLADDLFWRDFSTGTYPAGANQLAVLTSAPLCRNYRALRLGYIGYEKADRRFQANLRRIVPELDLQDHLQTMTREAHASTTIGKTRIGLNTTFDEILKDSLLSKEWALIDALWLELAGKENSREEIKGVFASLPPPRQLDSQTRLRIFLDRLQDLVGCFVITKPVDTTSKVKQRIRACLLKSNSCRKQENDTVNGNHQCGPSPQDQARDSIYSVMALAQIDPEVNAVLERANPGRYRWDPRNVLNILYTNEEVRRKLGEISPCKLPSELGTIEITTAPRCDPNAILFSQGYASPLSLAPNQCYYAHGDESSVSAALFMADICITHNRGLSSETLQPKPNDAIPDEVIPSDEDTCIRPDPDDGDELECGWSTQQLAITSGIVVATAAVTVAATLAMKG